MTLRTINSQAKERRTFLVFLHISACLTMNCPALYQPSSKPARDLRTSMELKFRLNIRFGLPNIRISSSFKRLLHCFSGGGSLDPQASSRCGVIRSTTYTTKIYTFQNSVKPRQVTPLPHLQGRFMDHISSTEN